MPLDARSPSKRLGSGGHRLAAFALVALSLLVLSVPAAGASPAGSHGEGRSLNLDELTIAQIESAFKAGRLSCKALIRAELERIEAYDDAGPKLNAVITVNPDAMQDAAAMDVKRARGKRLGSAACVPVVIKDNIETEQVRTTFGSPLFSDWTSSADAPIVKRLRSEGAIVLAKGNLDDFAASVFGTSTIDGFIRNPYDTSRTVGGSSGGAAASVAAGYAPLAIGTDTGGSLRIPAAFNSVVTIRPTTGLVSQEGMSPRSRTQDTAGPLARTVADAATGLELIADPQGDRKPARSYASYAKARRLEGVRIGVIREGIPLWGGIEPGVSQLQERAIEQLESLGAEVVDVPQEFVDRLDTGFDCNDCLLDSSLITAESRRDLTEYLSGLSPAGPVSSFDELYNGGENAGRYTDYAKEAFDREAAVDLDDPATAADYQASLQRQSQLREATLGLFAEQDLDAVMYPSSTWFPDPIGVEQSGVFTRWSEQTGYPAIGVPMGYGTPVENPGEKAVPASLELLGKPYGEASLIRIAAAYERAAKARKSPTTTPATHVQLSTPRRGHGPQGGGHGGR